MILRKLYAKAGGTFKACAFEHIQCGDTFRVKDRPGVLFRVLSPVRTGRGIKPQTAGDKSIKVIRFRGQYS